MPSSSDLRNGPVVRNPAQESSLYAVNRDAFRTADAASVFRGVFADEFRAPGTLYLVAGTDSGLLPVHLVARGLPEGSRVLFVEEPSVLADLQRLGWQPPADDRIVITTPGELEASTAAVGLDQFLLARAARTVRSLAVLDGHLPGYAALAGRLDGFVAERAWHVQTDLSQEKFANADLVNLADNVQPAALLSGIYAGRTGILLAGGPSLTQLLPWVRRHRDALVVLAVSRVAGQLLDAGITPDVLFAIDPNETLWTVSSEMLAFADHALFVHSTSVQPTLLQQWAGRAFYLGHPVPWDEAAGAGNLSVTGPTVTNTAVSLAIVTGIGRLILGGVDLCFGRDGESHAPGSLEDEVGPQLQDLGTTLETNAGHRAQTTRAYLHAATVLAQQAAFARRHGMQMVNPVAEAARVEGVDFVPIEELPIPPSPGPRPPAIDPLTDALRMAHYRWALGELLRVEARLATRPTPTALTAADPAAVDAAFGVRLGDLAAFVRRYGIAAISRASLGDPATAGGRTAEAWEQAAAGLLAQARQARFRLELRMEEAAAEPDGKRLALGWLHTGTPGHLAVMDKRRPPLGATLRAGEPELVACLESAFAEARERTTATQVLRLWRHDPQRLVGTARVLLSRRDRDALAYLQRAIARVGHDADFEHLSSGMIAELDDAPETALQAYQRVGPGPYLETALLQLASLLAAAGDLDNVLLALECLTHLSPAYMPQYAEALIGAGRTKDGLDEYARYFEQIPTDTANMLRLAAVYEQLDACDAAAMVYRFILEIDPNNAQAKKELQRL